MTAPSNPAAELTEDERALISDFDAGYYSCSHIGACPSLPCQNERNDIYTTVERILAARLAAGGAATDERQVHFEVWRTHMRGGPDVLLYDRLSEEAAPGILADCEADKADGYPDAPVEFYLMRATTIRQRVDAAPAPTYFARFLCLIDEEHEPHDQPAGIEDGAQKVERCDGSPRAGRHALIALMEPRTYEMRGFAGCTDRAPDHCACATHEQPTCEICDQEIEPGEQAWSRQWPCYETLALDDPKQDWDVIWWHDDCPSPAVTACRHRGGEDDCPAECVVIYGGTFVQAPAPTEATPVLDGPSLGDYWPTDAPHPCQPPGGFGLSAADTAAEEPRTEAQTLAAVLRFVNEATGHEPGYWSPRLAMSAIEALVLAVKAEALREAADHFAELSAAKSRAMQLVGDTAVRVLHDRADRLSRANEEAGS